MEFEEPLKRKLAAFRPYGPQVLASGTNSEKLFGHTDIWTHSDTRTYSDTRTLLLTNSVKHKFSPSSLSRLVRDPKMFRNLKTNRPKVPAKFGQDWSRGFGEKWLQGTYGFVDL